MISHLRKYIGVVSITLLVIMILGVVVVNFNLVRNKYQYEIHMNDGTIQYAWSVTCTGGVMCITSRSGIDSDYYYLSQTQYKKIVYVGIHTLKK